MASSFNSFSLSSVFLREITTQLADWLLANQLTTERKLVALTETWEKSPSPILRRWFWYHQASLRWMGVGGQDSGVGEEIREEIDIIAGES